MEALASAYGDDSDSEGDESPEEEVTPDHTAHLKSGVSISQLQSKIQLKSAPAVTAKVGVIMESENIWICYVQQQLIINFGTLKLVLFGTFKP